MPDSNIGPTEVSFEIRGNTEFATLHADTFRTAMRERDELREAYALSEAACLIQVKAARAEADELRAEVERFVAWRKSREDELLAENERLRAALEGVLAEADRKTDAFDRAHAALE